MNSAYEMDFDMYGAGGAVGGNGSGIPPPHPPIPGVSAMAGSSGSSRPMSDSRAKTVLKEAVDAVVNSFAKHTHGYGRGKYKLDFSTISQE
jgi:LIX1-like protein